MLQSLAGAPERAMHKAVRMKLTVQWRLQEVRDAKNVECQLGKAAVSEQSQLKGETIWAATRTSIRVRWLKLFGVHIAPHHVRVLGMEIKVLMFALLVFSFASSNFFLFLYSFLSEW